MGTHAANAVPDIRRISPNVAYSSTANSRSYQLEALDR